MFNDNKIKPGKCCALYGIGIGPGDPGLITVKGRELIERAGIIFVPKAKNDSVSCAKTILKKMEPHGQARGTILRRLAGGILSKDPGLALSLPKGQGRGLRRRMNIRDKKIVELVFPMTKDKKELELAWGKSADIVAKEMCPAKMGVFLTIGDPYIYSTYVYLRKMLASRHPEIYTETVPGITSFSAVSSRLEMPLLEGDEKMAVIPGTDLDAIRMAVKECDTVVIMKIGSKLREIINLINDIGLVEKSVLVSKVGQDDETVVRNINSIANDKLGYLSVMIIRKNL